MAESRESSDVDKSKTEFLNRVKTVKSEIRSKFLNLRKDLEDQELSALEKVEKIEREILEKFERASASLKEISQVRDGILAGLKSNATNNLLKKSLEMYDKEIEQIKLDSKIDSTIKLVWKLEQLASICEVSSSVGPSPQVVKAIPVKPKCQKVIFPENPFSTRAADSSHFHFSLFDQEEYLQMGSALQDCTPCILPNPIEDSLLTTLILDQVFGGVTEELMINYFKDFLENALSWEAYPDGEGFTRVEVQFSSKQAALQAMRSLEQIPFNGGNVLFSIRQ